MQRDDSKLSSRFFGDGLLLAATILTIIGLVMVYAASAMKGAQQFSDSYLFIRKQAGVGLVGFLAIFILSKLSEVSLRKLTLPLFLSSIVLLSLILVPGVYSSGGGAARWINIFGIRFQSSELAKIAIVFLMAKSLSRPLINVNDFRTGIAPHAAITAVFSLFLMLQPDFGSTVLMNVVIFSLFCIAGLHTRYIAYSICAGAVAIAAAIAVAPYRMARLTSFLDPWAQIQGGGFQIIQSYLAFHNGGVFGVGLGESKQKLFFLPEAHTDFILSVIGEELGFFGVSLIVFLFAFFVYCGLQIAKAQPNSFRAYLAYGFTALIGIQAIINMSVSMGLLPTKGIPLPFISSGASSLFGSLIATGVIYRLSKVN